MSDSGEYATMNDPDFLAERKRVREELQELTARYRKLNEEFDRRAKTAWASASLGGASEQHTGDGRPAFQGRAAAGGGSAHL
jgi:hypothetical protein